MPPERHPDKPTLRPDVTADYGDNRDTSSRPLPTIPGASPSAKSELPPGLNSPGRADKKLGTPRRIASYEILDEIGRGGMGVVYKAQDLRLKRIVALKVILAGGHAGDVELARFQTEAESVARLKHHNFVQIYEVGSDEGLPFLALEYCPGGSLEDRIVEFSLTPRESAGA